MAKPDKNSKQSKYTSQKKELKEMASKVDAKVKSVPKRKLSTDKSKPMIVPEGIQEAVKILGNVIDADEFLNSLNNDLNQIAQTQGDCDNNEELVSEVKKRKPSEAISRRVEPVRLKNVVQKQDIQRAVVSLKAEESLKMSDLEKVVLAQQSGKEFLAKTKIIPNKKEVAENKYRSSEIRVKQPKKDRASKLSFDFKKTIQKARDTKQFSQPVPVEIPEEDVNCKSTVTTDAERQAGKEAGDKINNLIVAEAVENEELLQKLAAESEIPIEELEEYVPPETTDERELAKREGEESANKLIAGILGGVLVAGALASAVVIAFKFKSNYVRQQIELDEILKKIQEVAANNKSFMDDVQAELERIPGYLDDYFHSWFLFDYYLYTLLLRYIEVNQPQNIDTLQQQMVEIIDAVQDGEDRKSPMANAIIEKTVEKLNRIRQGIWSGSTVPNGPSIDSLNKASKVNQVRNIVRGQIESLSNRSNAAQSNDIVYDYSVNQGEKTTGSLYNFLVVTSREPTQQEAETNKYVENILSDTEAYYRSTMMDVVIPANENQMKNAAQVSYKLVSYLGNLGQVLTGWQQILTKVLTSTEKLRDAYEFTHPEFNEQRVREQIAEAGMEVDAITGNTIQGGGGGGSGGAALSKSASEGNSELEFPTPPPATGLYSYSADNMATLEQFKYWQYWAGVLNIVTLSPQYWTTGIYVPGPNGVTKIPLPIFWIPLVVIPTPFAVMVIFLTVNGIVISPTVWMMTFKPLPDSKSRHIVLFRGANVKITDKKIETKTAGDTVVGGLDVLPQQHMSSILIKDDIPIPERMTLGNFLWVKYLNSWCSTAKPKMGLP